MDRLYAPWRMPYILSEVEKEKLEAERKKLAGGCIFCDLPGEGPDNFRENLILGCGEHTFIILNRYPYNNGHLMVVPRRHVSDPSLLDDREYRMLSELLRRATQALYRATGPHAVNLGMNLGRTAGAGIHEHCHYHLVPRWDGDNNFMPVVGNIKVISEGLHATYDRFFDHFKELVAEVEGEIG